MDDPRRREANKRAVERFYAVMNARDVDAIAKSYAEDASIAVMAPTAAIMSWAMSQPARA
jgi:ketosteroid isomerase-like protein